MKKAFIIVVMVFFTFVSLENVFSKYNPRAMIRKIEYYSQKMKSSNEAVRLSAIKELARIPHKKALKPLIKALSDRNIFIRKRACQALANLNYHNAVPPLIRRLKIEKELLVQREVIKALGKLKHQRARWILIRFTKHRNLGLRILAKKALKELDQD